MRSSPPKPAVGSQAAIDAFADVCSRLGGFDPRISTEWADGFLTALAAGPRRIEADEWIPAMAGDAFDRAFADPQSKAEALGALEAHAKLLARRLDGDVLLDEPDRLYLEPLLFESEDETTIGADWASGFIDAVHTFRDDWRPPEPGAELLLSELLHVVCAPTFTADALKDHLAASYLNQTLKREDLIDEACFAVQELRMFWIDHAPRPEPRRVEAQPGRNDPCPCGSGKKWKRCHGA